MACRRALLCAGLRVVVAIFLASGFAYRGVLRAAWPGLPKDLADHVGPWSRRFGVLASISRPLATPNLHTWR